MRPYQVGVFPMNSQNGPKFTAFTRGYDPGWEGCCVHEVMATRAVEATRRALAEHVAGCLGCGESHPSAPPTLARLRAPV